MKGLWNKYIISKASGKPLADGFQAIVLRVDDGQYVKACRSGVKAFARSVRKANPLLADDLENMLQHYDFVDFGKKLDKESRKLGR